MTPHEARPGVGTLKVDLVLGKLGRFNRATGTKDRDLALEIARTLQRLARERRYDLLEPMVRGIVSPLELHRALMHGTVGSLPTPETVWPLERVVGRWLDGFDRSERTKEAYRIVLRALGGITLGDLPATIRARRLTALASGKRPSFNRLHTAATMMLRQTLGVHHPLTHELENIERLREAQYRRVGNPFNLAQAFTFAEDMAKAGYGKHTGNFWSLCFTGMRADEYFSRRWRMTDGAVEILGTKSRDAKREVPLVYPLTQPTCSADHFRHILQKVGVDRRPHDCRYTFVRWAELAGVPVLHIHWYAGHEVKSVTELYRRGPGFKEFLEADAEKLRKWFGAPPKMGLRLA